MTRLRPLEGRVVSVAGAVRRRIATTPAVVLLAVLLTSCATPRVTTTPPAPAAEATPTVSPRPHGERIRFALIGSLTPANVWSLFDSRGHAYNDYAVRSGYWPRLYHLSVPDEQFEPEAASAMPSAVQQEGASYTATVPLRADLTWSDGTAFTASDVAFTVNTALKFQLGFDWHDYYDPLVLDHAEALDAGTVKFFFKHAPDVGAWQYGALQGPVVQEKYWSATVATAAANLPSAEVDANTAALRAQIAEVQMRLNALYAQAAVAQKDAARQVQASIKREQGDLDQATNDLTDAQAQYDQAMQSARDALYGLEDTGEPRLGRWAPTDSTDAAAGTLENAPSADFAGTSNFDRAEYHLYPTRAAALAALQAGSVDVVLDTAASDDNADAGPSMVSPDRAPRFVFFNLRTGLFKEAAIRQALACMIDQSALASMLGSQTSADASYVPAGEGGWYAGEAHLPCAGLDAPARLIQATEMLQAAGYTWTKMPAAGIAGEGLASPDGQPLSAAQVMAPAADAFRSTAAKYIVEQAQLLGIPLAQQSVTADVLDYAVFSSGQFDAAVVGWRVSTYPGYLCDWVGAGGPFEYAPSQVTSLCGELQATSDLGAAQMTMRAIQASLARDVPLIPLYTGVVRDPYRNVVYPFSSVLGGLAGAYGAPGLALPAAP